MPLQKIDVLVADPAHPDDTEHATTHRVTVLHGDRLAAERNAAENGIPHDGTHGQAFTSLVLWNALRRTGVHNEPYQQFLPRILDTDPVEEPPTGEASPPEHLEGLADPTRPTPGEEPASASHSSLPASGPGSTGLPTEDPAASTSTA